MIFQSHLYTKENECASFHNSVTCSILKEEKRLGCGSSGRARAA
jgi:hypothetical protein